MKFKKVKEGDLIDRDDMLAVNSNFELIEARMGSLGLKYIDCGDYECDPTGDTVRIAMQKINHNFAKLSESK